MREKKKANGDRKSQIKTVKGNALVWLNAQRWLQEWTQGLDLRTGSCLTSEYSILPHNLWPPRTLMAEIGVFKAVFRI